jgi:hypothetical protein
MKVKLNEYESWEINLKSVYEPQEFLSLVERFSDTAKMIKKDFLISSSISKTENHFEEDNKPRTPKTYTKKSTDESKFATANRVMDTKEKAIEVKKLLNFGTKEEIQRFCNENGIERNALGLQLYKAVIKFNISAKNLKKIKKFVKDMHGNLLNGDLYDIYLNGLREELRKEG